jgi:hypothetical protein
MSSKQQITLWPGMPRSPRLLSMFAKEVDKLAEHMGFEWNDTQFWLGATVAVESGWNPLATNPIPGQTAAGLLQWTEKTPAHWHTQISKRVRAKKQSAGDDPDKLKEKIAEEYALQIPYLARSFISQVGKDNNPSPHAIKRDSKGAPVAWIPHPSHLRTLNAGGLWVADMSMRPNPDDFNSYIAHPGGSAAAKVNPDLQDADGNITTGSILQSTQEKVKDLIPSEIPRDSVRIDASDEHDRIPALEPATHTIKPKSSNGAGGRKVILATGGVVLAAFLVWQLVRRK